MSTFTPYDRTIKETINVGFEDRITNQRVVFANKTNVYNGHFIGDAVLIGNPESGSTITNYGIVDSTLSGCNFIDENGQNVSFADFHGETVSALTELSGYCDLLSAKIDAPISGFEYETISGNQDLSAIYEGDFNPEELTKVDTLCALRYVFQTLGKWRFEKDLSGGISVVTNGSNQLIRY